MGFDWAVAKILKFVTVYGLMSFQQQNAQSAIILAVVVISFLILVSL